MALFLQHPISRTRSCRVVLGSLIAILLLLTHPLSYGSDTQPFGLMLSVICAETAWTLLHLAILEPLEQQPSVVQVLVSPIQHVAAGVRKGYQRAQRMRQRSLPPGFKQQAFNEDNTHEQHASTNQQPPPSLASFLETVEALLLASMLHDVGLYLLCGLTCMCDGGSSSISGGGGGASSPCFRVIISAPQVSYMQKCLFGLPAALLLAAQLDLVYAWIVLVLKVFAVFVPDARNFVAQLPKHAFNGPLAASSVAEFWGLRWHQLLRWYFEGMGYAAADALYAVAARALQLKSAEAPHAVRLVLHSFAAFLFSGVLHEYVPWALGQAVRGNYVLFFLIHWLTVLMEMAVAAAFAGVAVTPTVSRALAMFKRCWTWAVCLLTAPLFVEQLRSAGFYSTCALHPFGGVPLTPRIVERVSAGVVMGQA